MGDDGDDANVEVKQNRYLVHECRLYKKSYWRIFSAVL